MKNSILSIFSIVATLFAVLLLSLSVAGGEIIVSAEADEGKSLSSLDAGDIVRVTVVLPKVENTS